MKPSTESTAPREPTPPSESRTIPGGAIGRRPTVGRWLLLLVAGFLLGPLSISNLWGYLQTRSYLIEAAFQNIGNVAALEASETREFVRASENLLPSIIAGNQHLFRTLRALESATTGAQREAMRTALRVHLAAKSARGSSVEEFYILSPQGQLIASSGPVREHRARPSGDPCFLHGTQSSGIAGFEYPKGREDEPSQGGEPSHRHSHSARTDSEQDLDAPRLVVASPIRDDQGTLLGLLCGRFAFSIHRNLLVAHKHRTDQADVYLLDDQGRIVCGSFEDLASAPFGEALPASAQLELGSGRSWQGRYVSAEGAAVMLSYAPIPDLGWSIVVEVPVTNALAGLERLKWEAVAASALLAAVLSLAVYLSWRTLVRPLRALSRTSDQMASGTPGATVAPRGPREVAELATAFNRMSLALKESHETLETRIAERTLMLRESQEFLELLLDSIDQRVVVVDSECRILKANAAAARMHGRPLEGATSYQVFEQLTAPPSDFPALRTFRTGRPASGERSQITARGREAVVVETYPIFDSDRRIESVVEIGRVVTTEKRLQVQMIYQEKMAAFGQLAAGIAHEIGNPLAAIESQLRMAQRAPDRVSETLDIVGKQVARIGRLLRDLVDFSRRRRGEVTLSSVNQAVDDVIRLVQHDPRSRNVEILRHLSRRLPGIRATEDHLVQVVLNLALNALDALPQGGRLEFETSYHLKEVIVRVRDSGGGVAPEALPHLFEPFFTTKGAGRGTGLGLFVSRRIAESLGGSLELEGTGSGGTSFILRLHAEEAPISGVEQ